MKKPKPLAARLRSVSALLRRDRQALIDSETWPGRGLDAECQEMVAEYDQAIRAVVEAIEAIQEAA